MKDEGGGFLSDSSFSLHHSSFDFAAVAQMAGGAGPRSRNVRVRIPPAASLSCVRERSVVAVPFPSRIVDADELSVVFEDHSECIYLGEWTELVIGHVRLVRNAKGEIEVEELIALR